MMTLASAPTTPERPVQPPSIRRAFTAPIKSSRGRTQSTQGWDGDGETLFAHEAAKIVSFTAPSAGRLSPSSSDRGATTSGKLSGTLPWASHTERIVAAGKLISTLKCYDQQADRSFRPSTYLSGPWFGCFP